MRRRRFTSLLLICATVLAMLLAGTAFAANTTELSIAQIRQNGGELYLYLTGVNERGEAALDTASWSDYAVSMSGTELQVTSAEACESLNETIHYIVCVDISGSIGGKGFTKDTNEPQYVKDALNSMIGDLRANEKMTLFSFGNKVTSLVEFSDDKAALYAAVEGLSFKDGNTALYEVINESTKFAWNNRESAQRSAVLIITDGTDDANGGSSNYTYENIRNDVRKRNVPVYTATFFREDSAGGTESLNELRDLGSVSGGRLSNLPNAEEGYRMTDVVTNIQSLTRSSTRLTAQLTSELERGDGTFQVSMAVSGGTLDTPEHSFVVSWNDVPAPTPVPDLTLETLEIDDITEDSTAIRGTTEENSIVRVDRNGELIADIFTPDGRINISFKDKLSEDFHLNKGDVITVSAFDASGNSKLPNGADGRVRKTVGESSRADITVSIDGIGNDGFVYGERMTVRGTAQENTEVLVSWQPDEGERMVYGPISTRGKTYSCTLNAEECTLGTGTVVVLYADYQASSRQGYYEGAVNWIKEKPIEELPVVLEMPSAISEDSKSIQIKTEPNAEVSLIVDGSKVSLGEAAHADAEGNWEYSLVNNSAVTLRKDRKLKIEVTDSFGRTAESGEITIEGSTRRDITVNVSRMGEDEIFYGDTIKVQGTAERETSINVSLWDFSTQTLLGSKQVESGGNFMAEFKAADCGVEGDSGTECYIQAEYADNLAESKTFVGTSFVWVGHEPIVQKEAKLEVKRLREDSSTLHIESEPNTEVVVVNLTQEEEIATGVTDSDGVCEFELGAAGVATLCQDDEIEITIVSGGEEKSIVETVGEAKRAQITVSVKDLEADATINRESIVVQGVAEPNEELIVYWMANDADASAAPEMVQTTVSQNGWYEATLPKDGFTEGFGNIRVKYADGLADSKQGTLEQGRIEWIQVTPSPTPTLPPTPTPIVTTPPPTPTPEPATPTPSPVPTPTPHTGILKLVDDISDTFHSDPGHMLRDWHFWLVVAVALVLIALIVLLIVFLVRKGRKDHVDTFTPDDDIQREGEYAEMGTVRKKTPEGGSGTRRVPNEPTETPTGTVNMGKPQDFSPVGEGTVRLSAVDKADSSTGTVRLSANMGPKPMFVRIHETRDWAGVSQDSTLSIMEEATIGRVDDNDLVIRDETVSGHHLKLIRRENELFALDLMSSNGTMYQGQRLSVETKLNSGDQLIIGRTTLTIEFD